MIDLTRSFPIDADAERAHAFLMDFANAEQWDPGTRACRRLDEGPIAVGARWHNRSKFGPFSTALEYVLEEMTAERLVFRGRNAGSTTTDELTLVPAGPGRATMTYHATVEMQGLSRLIEPPFGLYFRRLAGKTVAQLQRTLAALEPDPAGASR